MLIGQGVTRLQKTGFVYLLGFFGGRGRSSGAISCVWSAWANECANVGSIDFFFTYGEYGVSLKGSWSYSR